MKEQEKEAKEVKEEGVRKYKSKGNKAALESS